MAKKTAPKKKAAPSKAKSVKATKPAKAAKPAAKPAKPAAKAAKPVTLKAVKAVPAKVPAKEVSKPSLMTKKGKAVVEETPVVEAKKANTIVSLIEAAPEAAEPAKAEKLSKVKPVKVDRGNVADEKAKWAELFKKYGKDKAITYKMTETYPSLIPLQHKVLGWGFVLTNENDRLEVLFENGIRMLISNYKS
ncbi:MAG: hypothetical protein ACXVAX_08305 [Pseudobdellovibrio sp.]